MSIEALYATTKAVDRWVGEQRCRDCGGEVHWGYLELREGHYVVFVACAPCRIESDIRIATFQQLGLDDAGRWRGSVAST